MKKLSDYKGEEAIELWADLLDPIVEIVGDPDIANMLRAKKPHLIVAKEVIKHYRKQAVQILERVDPTPVNGLNVLFRVVDVMKEIGEDPTYMHFFESVAGNEGEKPSGSAMASTEGEEI